LGFDLDSATLISLKLYMKNTVLAVKQLMNGRIHRDGVCTNGKIIIVKFKIIIDDKLHTIDGQSIYLSKLSVEKRSGNSERFSKEKLVRGISRAGTPFVLATDISVNN
jgi:hypothetical protein